MIFRSSSIIALMAFGVASFAPISTTINSCTATTSPPSGQQACRGKYVSLFATEQPETKLPEIPFVTKTLLSDRSNDLMIGEDAGIFDIQNEEWGKLGDRGWFTFSVAVATILTAVAILWIYPPTGYADDFLAAIEDFTGRNNPHLVTFCFGILFPVVHSGLASLRPLGEQVVGSRIWRVIFAFPSLCLAYSWITYFIAHAHDGIQ
jgi:hypothetical protein